MVHFLTKLVLNLNSVNQSIIYLPYRKTLITFR